MSQSANWTASEILWIEDIVRNTNSVIMSNVGGYATLYTG